MSTVSLAVLACVLALLLAGALVPSFAQPPARGPALIAEARADAGSGMVSQVGAYTMMTTAGQNEDVLLVIDGRAEELLVYRTDNANGVQLMQRLNLPRAFLDARARAMGTP
jgi:hypothetical protein